MEQSSYERRTSKLKSLELEHMNAQEFLIADRAFLDLFVLTKRYEVIGPMVPHVERKVGAVHITSAIF